MHNIIRGKKKDRVTLVEIARESGVSKSTVSLVLNSTSNLIPLSDATRKKVLETAKLLGYRPNAAARSLVTGRSQAVLVAVLESRDTHLLLRIQGAESHLAPRRYAIHLCTVHSQVGLRAYHEVIRSDRADGVLLSGVASPDTLPLLQEMYTEAKESGKPVVAMTNAFPPEYSDAVASLDDVSGAEQAVSHLIQHGHHRIAVLGVSDQPWVEERIRGYELAHEKAGLPVDPDLIAVLTRFDDNLYRGIYQTTLEMVKSKEFTAIFAMNDVMAVSAMAALKRAGKNIPIDCAIIGFDNDSILAEPSNPPLTSVDNPFFELGREAARLMIELIEGRPVEPILFPASLVIRQSCGCP